MGRRAKIWLIFITLMSILSGMFAWIFCVVFDIAVEGGVESITIGPALLVAFGSSAVLVTSTLLAELRRKGG